jgi:hypothetical protein
MGTKPERNNPTLEGPDGELDRKIYDAMRLKGWVIPQTVEDVLRAEAELDGDDGCDDLPAELMDPYAILHRESARPIKVRPLHSAGDREAEKYLARAARDGREIPPEIEERMKRDRATAEGVGGSDDEGT